MLSTTGGPRATLALALTATVALLLGTAVYLMDRPAGSAWLLPSAWQTALQAPSQPAGPLAATAIPGVPAGTTASGAAGLWFGPAGLWLPSLVHAFAFSVLTALLLPRRPADLAAACVGWAAVDTLFEAGQHPAVAGPLAATLDRAFDGAPLAMRVGRYFTQGSFDVADVAAGWAGAALAGFVLLLAWHRAWPRSGSGIRRVGGAAFPGSINGAPAQAPGPRPPAAPTSQAGAATPIPSASSASSAPRPFIAGIRPGSST